MQGTTSSKIGPPRAGDPVGQLMPIQIEPHSDLRAAPRRRTSGRHHRNRGQWYGPGYRYVKVRAHDDSVYILRFDEICHWELIMFCAAPAQGWQRNYHDLARS